MKKSIITILAAVAMLFGSAFTSRAQGPGFDFNPDEIVKMIVGQMKESLNLTDDQVTKVSELQKKQMENMQKMFEGGGMPDMDAFQKQQDEQKAAMKKILTADQFKKWEEQQAQMMQGGFGGF
ncbi:MAG: hypothetical protein Q4G10_04155 [Bacteroidia bacterium]|nr:hypothetical protein [Bacteroidia bacterium]